MVYLLDTNIFIQAQNLHYSLDFCPAFWEWLIENNTTGKVFSIEKVRDEINAGKNKNNMCDDKLPIWAKERGEDFFLKPDASVLERLRDVSKWATTNRYEPAAVTTFLGVADCYLVAHALAYGYTIVTHETPSGTPVQNSNRVAKIKIPDVCAGMHVERISPHKIKCVSSYDMLREEKARFVLDPNR